MSRARTHAAVPSLRALRMESLAEAAILEALQEATCSHSPLGTRDPGTFSSVVSRRYVPPRRTDTSLQGPAANGCIELIGLFIDDPELDATIVLPTYLILVGVDRVIRPKARAR